MTTVLEPTTPGLPHPPSAEDVARRLCRSPATALAIADDLDCLVDQVEVVLRGWSCFAPSANGWGLVEWRLVPPELNVIADGQRPRGYDPELLWAIMCGALVAFVVLVIAALAVLVAWGLR